MYVYHNYTELMFTHMSGSGFPLVLPKRDKPAELSTKDERQCTQ